MIKKHENFPTGGIELKHVTIGIEDLFDLILIESRSTIFHLCWDRSSWVEQVLSKN